MFGLANITRFLPVIATVLAVAALGLLIREIKQTAQQEAVATLQLEQTQRQLASTRSARDKYRDSLADAQAGALVRQSKLENEIARYAHRLETEGRSCPLSDADIEWLLRE